MVWTAVLAFLVSTAGVVESFEPSASGSTLPEGEEMSVSSRKPLVRESSQAFGSAPSLVEAVIGQHGDVTIRAPDPAVEMPSPVADQADTDGCLIKEAGGNVVWIKHLDGTHNWVSRASTDCADDAGAFSSEHIAEMTKRTTNYILNEAQSVAACANQPCEADTHGCVIKGEGGYFFLVHADLTRNWIDNPTRSCSVKATIASRVELAKYSKRAGGLVKGTDRQDEEVSPTFNLGDVGSGKACQNPACGEGGCGDGAAGAASMLVDAGNSQTMESFESQSLAASEAQWEREIRVRFGPDFGKLAKTDQTVAKAHTPQSLSASAAQWGHDMRMLYGLAKCKPASCCNASSCVLASAAPDCTDVNCGSAGNGEDLFKCEAIIGGTTCAAVFF